MNSSVAVKEKEGPRKKYNDSAQMSPNYNNLIHSSMSAMADSTTQSILTNRILRINPAELRDPLRFPRLDQMSSAKSQYES